MSSPIKDDSSDDRLTYAPPWARVSGPTNEDAKRAEDELREEAPQRNLHADRSDDASQWDQRADHPDDALRWDEHANHPDDALRWNERAGHSIDAPPYDERAGHSIDAPPYDERAGHPPDVPRWDARPDRPDDRPQWDERAGHPRDLDLHVTHPVETADAPATAPRAGEQAAPRRSASTRPFEGDVAVRELRTRLTLDPHLVPEPPPERSSSSAMMRILRFFGIGAVAAGVAYVVVVFAFPDARRPAPDTDDAAFAPTVVTSKKTDRVAATTQDPTVRLVLEENRRIAVNEAAPLGVEISGPLDRGTVIVDGLAAGARVSAGAVSGAGSWRVPLPELAQAAVEPPADFVGTMDLAVELRSADEMIMDRGAMQIEWVPARRTLLDRTQDPAQPERALALGGPPPQSSGTPLDRDEIAMLLARGRRFIAQGDLSSARLVLRRAAEAGDASAALLLGSTYDPAMFRKWGVVGSAPDPEEALRWYQRAGELGSDEATRRLEPLASNAQ